METIEFVLTINQLRRANKEQWYFWTGVVDDKCVEIKGFNTWLQIFRVDGVQQNTTMGNSVKEFTAELTAGVS
jgi:hypothetical protein